MCVILRELGPTGFERTPALRQRRPKHSSHIEIFTHAQTQLQGEPRLADSQIRFRALPPEETALLHVPLESDTRRTFRVGASVKTAGREGHGGVSAIGGKTTLKQCLWVKGKNADRYSLTRPPWEARSSAQHGECASRKVSDLSPGWREPQVRLNTPTQQEKKTCQQKPTKCQYGSHSYITILNDLK